MNYIIFYYFLLLNCMDKSKNEEEKEIKISEDNESYLSDDDDTPEDLFLFLMNVANTLFHQSQISSIDQILDSFYLKALVLKIEPTFEIKYSSLEFASILPGIGDVINNDVNFSNLRIFLTSFQTYFMKLKMSGSYKLKNKFEIFKMINFENLKKKQIQEIQNLAKLVLVFISTSSNSGVFLDKLAEQREEYLDGFLNVVQEYIELNDESTADKIDPKQRRFTKRSSITSFNNPSSLYSSIDKLRKRVKELEEELKNNKNEIAYLNHKLKTNSIIVAESITSSSQKETQLVENLNKVTKDYDELKIKYDSEAKTLKQQCAEFEKKIFDMKILNDKSKDILEENELLKKEFEEYKKNSQDKIEKLKSSNQSLISNVNNLEKAKRLLENKTISLRNDLRIEQQKNNTDLLTIKTLQNKFKNFEQAKKEIDEENEKNRELYEESEYTKQINQLISDMQEKNTTICVLNQEILELNEKFKFKSILTKNKIIEFTVDGRYHDYQTEILQLKEDIRRRDRDIAFLKNAYNDISLKSEEEYNTVSSSLYELAFHLTKIKDNVIPSPKKITSNNSNLDSPS